MIPSAVAIANLPYRYADLLDAGRYKTVRRDAACVEAWVAKAPTLAMLAPRLTRRNPPTRRWRTMDDARRIPRMTARPRATHALAKPDTRPKSLMRMA